jgi:hypothetical protein
MEYARKKYINFNANKVAERYNKVDALDFLKLIKQIDSEAFIKRKNIEG